MALLIYVVGAPRARTLSAESTGGRPARQDAVQEAPAAGLVECRDFPILGKFRTRSRRPLRLLVVHNGFTCISASGGDEPGSPTSMQASSAVAANSRTMETCNVEVPSRKVSSSEAYARRRVVPVAPTASPNRAVDGPVTTSRSRRAAATPASGRRAGDERASQWMSAEAQRPTMPVGDEGLDLGAAHVNTDEHFGRNEIHPGPSLRSTRPPPESH